MRIGDHELLDGVALARLLAADALAGALLEAVRLDRQSLEIAAVAEGDHCVGVRDELLRGVVAGLLVGYLRPAVVAVGLAQVGGLRLDHREDPHRVAEQRLEVGDALLELLVLVLDALAFESGETAELHLQDGLRLRFREAELRHQAGARRLDVRGGADERDDRVEVVQRDAESFEDVRPLAGAAQVVLGAAPDHVAAELDEVQERRAQAEHPRLAVDQGPPC